MPTKNDANIRMYGGANDGVWVAPPGTPFPATLDPELPAPWVYLGSLQNDFVIGVATSSTTVRRHQQNAVARVKATETGRTITVTAQENTPTVQRLYNGATEAVETVPGSGEFDYVLPEHIKTVSVSAVIVMEDEDFDVREMSFISRLDITERGDRTISATEATVYEFTGNVIGDIKVKTNDPAFAPAETGV